jgi:hypothetical protein
MHYQPDMYENPILYILPGVLLDTLDLKQIRWPGHGVSATTPFQFVENEYMKAEEYESLLADPSDWILRFYLPRTCCVFKGFQKLYPFKEFRSYNTMLSRFSIFDEPQVIEAIEALLDAGKKAHDWINQVIFFDQELKEIGFPTQFGASTYAPFDALADQLRGTKGAMLDLYRQPDKVLEACEKMAPLLIKMAVSGAKRTGIPRVFIALHKGCEGFMSIEQFKRFYWPGLKQVMEGLINEGLTPCPFFEGDYESRLDTIADVPRGKAVYHFERTNIFKAKEILGKQVCIRGNVPLSLLSTGTTEEVKEYCKKLIDVVGKGGGFIMDATGAWDDAKPENGQAMVDFTREYGVYR